ncbi:uncharacterized protein LOC100142353 isoform X2 [Tribolium castaneum]|nr:PREDICTED: uncharacterized protein LOC100142353 [Tribolium castaneum]|eukprot:XP_008193139.1 PREDICTED: uncharacterized protein LOC100142353 [Tribolium castaneum]
MRSTCVLPLLAACALALKMCAQNHRFLKFHKLRSCFKSTLPILSWKQFDNVRDCMQFTRDKNGLAFNFSPPELQKARSCEVLGCPEVHNSTTFVFDPSYDYYSAYGDFNSTANATCLRSVGLFQVVQEKMNYSSAARRCQDLGGDLADILTEARTNALAALLKSLPNWYKGAYVGLDDITVEGSFETPMGDFLQCSRFRAWAVGHPRPGRRKEDCVMLDVEKTWRALNCKIKLDFICEFYPTPPDNTLNEFKYQNCSLVKSKKKKQECETNNELFELYNSSTRIDQCALMNDFEF